MTTLALHHFNLRAAQPLLDQLRDFYTEVVGLHVGWRPPFASTGYWLYLGTTPLLHLVEGLAPADGTRPVASTLDHIAFLCSDLPAVQARLTRLGIAFGQTTVPTLPLVQLFLHDPAGNGVEFNFELAA